MALGGCRTTGESNEFYTDWEETFESFDQMNLHENLLRGIYAYGGSLSAATSLLENQGCCCQLPCCLAEALASCTALRT